ncbi:MAG TPA: glycerophosphodiester phosphodiesterase family protein [Candidatus Latescibacteria bacterium]|nr:glycerophosphodiester phosphodiesterase family protein [Candidatus Latescibacterota bacterium]
MRSKYRAECSPRRLWVVAHRGFSGRYPENTMAAFKAAVALGVDVIEIDVHLSRDGHVVIMHDAKLDRTTDGKGPIAEHTLAEIKRVDAGSKKGAQFAGERVPTFAEMLAEISLPVMCEIKDPGEDIVRETARVVKAAGAEDRVIIACFDDATLRWAEHYLPACERLALGQSTAERIRTTHINAPSFEQADEAFVKAVHETHGAVWLWTVDQPADIRNVIALGVDGIISNYPDRVLAVLA